MLLNFIILLMLGEEYSPWKFDGSIFCVPVIMSMKLSSLWICYFLTDISLLEQNILLEN
jgi:hypothetical protein